MLLAANGGVWIVWRRRDCGDDEVSLWLIVRITKGVGQRGFEWWSTVVAARFKGGSEGGCIVGKGRVYMVVAEGKRGYGEGVRWSVAKFEFSWRRKFCFLFQVPRPSIFIDENINGGKLLFLYFIERPFITLLASSKKVPFIFQFLFVL